jgi:hypothetical protein
MIKRFLLIALMGGLALPAFGDISLQLQANFDATKSTKYPNGDKPQGGTCPPSGWSGIALGDGGGEICAVSASEFDIAARGTNQGSDNYIVHKDGGGGEVQIECRITATYAGASGNFAAAGCGIRESATDTSWLFQVHSLQNGATALQCLYGASGSYTSVNGGAGQARPRYVAVTYHPSSGDVRGHASDDGSTWTEICATTRTLSDDEVYVMGMSQSTTATLSATIDNIAVATEIDAYDEGGGGGGGPTLVTQIENQTLTQSSAFTLSVASNFTGELSYTATGLPGAGGLSFNAATGEFTGVPDADDVTASPFNVEVCAWTALAGGGLSTCDTAQFTVSAVPGDTFLLADVMTSSGDPRVVNCATEGVGPGDTIVIPGGITLNQKISFNNCVGTENARITIRNDTTDNEAAIYSKTDSDASPTYMWRFNNNEYVTVTGCGKYSGAPAGTLGVDETTRELNRVSAGIILREVGAAVDPQNFIFVTALSRRMTFECIEIDGDALDSGVGGAGLQVNDHSQLASANPGFIREELTFSHMYVHDVGRSNDDLGEGLYIGPGISQDIPLGDITVEYNIVENTSRDGITVKSAVHGTQLIQYNYVSNTGIGGSQTRTGQNEGFAIGDTVNYTARGNMAVDTGGPCFRNGNDDTHAGTADGTGTIENNMWIRCGQHTPTNGHCLQIQIGSNDAAVSATVSNDTCVDPDDNGYNFGGDGTHTVRNSIITGAATAVSGATSDNNRTTSLVFLFFVDDSGNEFADFELEALSAACNDVVANAPATDYEGESRPMGTASDQGADESDACP